jgi:hypothetical protein
MLGEGVQRHLARVWIAVIIVSRFSRLVYVQYTILMHLIHDVIGIPYEASDPITMRIVVPLDLYIAWVATMRYATD